MFEVLGRERAKTLDAFLKLESYEDLSHLSEEMESNQDGSR